MSKAGLKAGLIGGGIVAVLQIVGLIRCVGCFTWLLGWVAYVGAGVLAAYWLPLPRDAGEGAGAGAIAGVIAAVIGGIVGMTVSGIQFAITGGSAAVLSQMPRESLEIMRDAGIDPAIFANIGAVLGASALCCVVGMVIAAVLGAIGGAVFAALQSE